mmetsp:Transcript_43504/g.130493  ORF Transcript_43504/g.130493 Transcript_43504/m.130493 type:complete len:272 (+) Transcript_43504:1203-2018(+)
MPFVAKLLLRPARLQLAATRSAPSSGATAAQTPRQRLCAGSITSRCRWSSKGGAGAPGWAACLRRCRRGTGCRAEAPSLQTTRRLGLRPRGCMARTLQPTQRRGRRRGGRRRSASARQSCWRRGRVTLRPAATPRRRSGRCTMAALWVAHPSWAATRGRRTPVARRAAPCAPAAPATAAACRPTRLATTQHQTRRWRRTWQASALMTVTMTSTPATREGTRASLPTHLQRCRNLSKSFVARLPGQAVGCRCLWSCCHRIMWAQPCRTVWWR